MDNEKIWNNEHPFKVPEGYFENFESSLKHKIDKEKRSAASLKRKFYTLTPWVGIAATFLIIALIYRQVPDRVFLEKFEQEQIIEIFLNKISPADYFKEYELIDFLAEDDLIEFDLFPDSLLLKHIEDEDIIMLSLIR